jgi:hypothetical protein
MKPRVRTQGPRLLMASARDLIVLAYLAGSENRFVPADRLTLTETTTPNPAARKLASAFAYGGRHCVSPAQGIRAHGKWRLGREVV